MRTSIVPLVAIGFSLIACAHTGGEPAGGPTVAALVSPAPQPLIYRVPIDGLPVLGDSKALVTIVAFTDYQCSYCREAEATIAQLRSHYGRDVRLVVAEHPMPMHPNARPAALAALAAGAQGRFEGMHSRLFAGSLDEASIRHAASAEGLDLPRFEADRQGAAVSALDGAERIGKELGVPGTPAFFINGRMVIGPQPLATFEEVIDERLNAARRLAATGVPLEEVYARTIGEGLPHITEEC